MQMTSMLEWHFQHGTDADGQGSNVSERKRQEEHSGIVLRTSGDVYILQPAEAETCQRQKNLCTTVYE